MNVDQLFRDHVLNFFHIQYVSNKLFFTVLLQRRLGNAELIQFAITNNAEGRRGFVKNNLSFTTADFK